jgi:hypothetical protein
MRKVFVATLLCFGLLGVFTGLWSQNEEKSYVLHLRDHPVWGWLGDWGSPYYLDSDSFEVDENNGTLKVRQKVSNPTAVDLTNCRMIGKAGVRVPGADLLPDENGLLLRYELPNILKGQPVEVWANGRRMLPTDCADVASNVTEIGFYCRQGDSIVLSARRPNVVREQFYFATFGLNCYQQ